MRATSPPSVATSVEGMFFFEVVTKKSWCNLSDPILIVFAFAFFLVITADWVEERRYSHVGNKRSFQCCCSSQRQGLLCSVYGLTIGLHSQLWMLVKAMLHDTFRFELFNAMFCGKFTSERIKRSQSQVYFPRDKKLYPIGKKLGFPATIHLSDQFYPASLAVYLSVAINSAESFGKNLLAGGIVFVRVRVPPFSLLCGEKQALKRARKFKASP